MTKVSRLLATLVFAFAILGHAVPAYAATGWKTVDVTFQTTNQQPVLLVSGELPADAALPAEAELAVPAGMQINWVGEILGGPLENDPEIAYTKSTANGMDVYRFTLTKSRIVQVEGTVPGVTSFDGKNNVTSLTWTPSQAVPEVRISERIPQSSKIVAADSGATLQPADGGFSYYTKTASDVQAGQPVSLSYSYAIGAAPATGTSAAGPSSSSAVPVLVLLIAVAGFAIVFYNVNRKMTALKAADEPVHTQTRAPKQMVDEGGFEDDAEPTIPMSREHAPVQPKKLKPIVPMLVVVGLFVVGFAIAGNRGISAVEVNGQLTRSFGGTDPCASASIPFTPNPGVDLAKDGDKLLAVFEGMEGVSDVTINLVQSKIDMTYCGSTQTEETMRQALLSAGLVTLEQQAPPTSVIPTASSNPAGTQ